MKFIVIFFISVYQLFISPFIHYTTGTVHACRYPVTCSDYAIEQIREKGILKGGFKAIKRILSCHPFAKPYPLNV